MVAPVEYLDSRDVPVMYTVARLNEHPKRLTSKSEMRIQVTHQQTDRVDKLRIHKRAIWLIMTDAGLSHKPRP